MGTKGQLISKGFLDILNSSEKRMKTSNTVKMIVLSSLRIEDTKKSF